MPSATEDGLDLTEIGVAGRVDDVDTRALPADRDHLDEDCDNALEVEFVQIERALGHA